MGDYREAFRKVLRTVRMICGYSQDSVAKALGVSRSTYTYYETGKTSPDVQTVSKLANIFNVSAEILVFPEEYVGTDLSNVRAPRKFSEQPQRIGELRAEEKELIAKHRLEKK